MGYPPPPDTGRARLALVAGLAVAVLGAPWSVPAVQRLRPHWNRLLTGWSLRVEFLEDVRFTTDGRRLVAAGRGNVRLVDLETRQLTSLCVAFTEDAAPRVALSGDANWAVCAERPYGRKHSLSVWDLRTRRSGAMKADLEGLGVHAVSHRGEMVAAVANRGVQLWEPATGQQRTLPLTGEELPRVLAFAPDGRALVGVNQHGPTWVWKLPEGGSPVTIRNPPTTLRDVQVSPDSRSFASCGNRGDIMHWQLDGRPARPPRVDESLRLTPMDDPRALAFSPDGRTLIDAGVRGRWDERSPQTLSVWDLATGKLAAEGCASGGCPFGVAVAPDGRTIATVDTADTITLWGPDARVLDRIHGPTYTAPGDGARAFALLAALALVALGLVGLAHERLTRRG